MSTTAEEKRPAETIQLGVDFAQALLTGEGLTTPNVTVTVGNLLTDTDATATILVAGSMVVSGTTVKARFHAGALGDLYQVLFSTGTTNFGNAYTATVNLVITNTPAGDQLIGTLDDLKLKLRIDPTDTSDDALLLYLLQTSTAYVVARSGRKLFFQTITEDIFLPCEAETDWVQLLEWPVYQIDSITLMPADLVAPLTITDKNAYHLTEEGELRLLPNTSATSYYFYTEPGFNRIVYRAGYPKIPDDLMDAALDINAIFYRAMGREGLSRERIGDYSYDALQAGKLPSGLAAELMDPRIEGVLQRYTRQVVWGS